MILVKVHDVPTKTGVITNPPVASAMRLSSCDRTYRSRDRDDEREQSTPSLDASTNAALSDPMDARVAVRLVLDRV